MGDALIWHGAGPELLREVVSSYGSGVVPYVARALLFRLVTTNEQLRVVTAERGSSASGTEVRRYARAVRVLVGKA
ncbi:hypothetical protein AB0B50_03095 [Streptomyces sp. NPDC041068]|uniref:hypothetical protein n=1 Tax=Streptomyces sp. NPDC041068 TaxID=3155130 RepID=UPI0033C43FBC